jgi:hypothetical protein
MALSCHLAYYSACSKAMLACPQLSCLHWLRVILHCTTVTQGSHLPRSAVRLSTGPSGKWLNTSGLKVADVPSELVILGSTESLSCLARGGF